jgi:MurNAc alpha-1-phosphate uridylyltransferase
MADMPRRAMALAAGLGLRMRPLTERMPKPMVPVAGSTLIDRTLDWLHGSGIDTTVVNTAYLAEMLEAHLATRRAPRIIVSREEVPLETGGGIFRALPHFENVPFFAVNSDALTLDGASPALPRMAKQWQDKHMDALLLLHPAEEAVGYDGEGDFFLERDGRLRRRQQGEQAPYVFTGVQILHPRLFREAPASPFSMNLLYNRLMDKEGRLPNIAGLVHDGAWLHVGDPEGLRKAEQFLSGQKLSA